MAASSAAAAPARRRGEPLLLRYPLLLLALSAAVAAAEEPPLPARGPGALVNSDPDCWFGALTYEHCCHWDFGPGGNSACWDQAFNHERCCGADCLTNPDRCRLTVDDALLERAVQEADNNGHEKWAMDVRRVGFMSQMKNLEGISPVASFLQHYERRREGLPGYGEAGVGAELFRWILCFGSAPLKDGCRFARRLLSREDTLRANTVLDIMLEYQETVHNRGNLVFRLALQLFDVCIERVANCPPQEAIASLLARELQLHQDHLAWITQQLRAGSQRGLEGDDGRSGHPGEVPKLPAPIFVPRLGTLADAFLAQSVNEKLLNHWQRAIEAWALSDDLTYLMLELINLATLLIHSASFFMAHAFAHFYLSELSARQLGLRGTGDPEDVSTSDAAREIPAAASGAVALLRLPSKVRFVFEPVCCFHGNVLAAQLYKLGKADLRVVEVGVHMAKHAEYLLDTFPQLTWVGVDPFSEESGQDSGDAMLATARRSVARFGARARVVREWSSVAWNSTGAIVGIEPESVDLVFIDGDHSHAVTVADLESWSRLVRPGGMIAGHDFLNPVNDGVTSAVLELCQSGKAGRVDGDPVYFGTDYTYWWVKPER